MDSHNMLRLQETHLPKYLAPIEDSYASPTKPASYRVNGCKERRPPSITPRKFTRFFTPRSNRSNITGASRRALFDITRSDNNRNGIQSSPVRPFNDYEGLENNPFMFTRELKRRKTMHVPTTTPDGSSPMKSGIRVGYSFSEDGSSADGSSYIGSPLHILSDAESDKEGDKLKETTSLRTITTMKNRGIAGRLLHISIGPVSNSKRRKLAYPVMDWQNNTASFYSRPEDRHKVTSSTSSIDPCVPFCTTSCNTNSLIAIGDEEGTIRLVESAKDGYPPFKDHYLAFRPHSNAIIDMAFSQDDSLIATASGDQSSSVIDMYTQQTVSILAAHTASVKQVKFQPGNASNSILATSARDGNVQIWDLRCRGIERPVLKFAISLDSADSNTPRPRTKQINYNVPVNTIAEAHKTALEGRLNPLVSPNIASRGEPFGRCGDVSVTAIQFLPEGNEHLLLTASEANASVKLWDIRAVHSTRRKTMVATPLSATALPRSHNSFRHFGISSIELNGDASRLYTVCKDNTIYAYSTPHLIMGFAPELSSIRSPRRRYHMECKEGLGPLYGFRHPKFLAASFYVKCAVRPAKYGKSEMLSVGSSDGCAVLFPTDERYMSQRPWLPELEDAAPSARRPHLTQVANNVIGADGSDNSIPISENGTPLIRGHDREVGALSWTFTGDLVTVGDDSVVRCWREGDDSRNLRTGGEEEGRRWGCGWADVDPKIDDED